MEIVQLHLENRDDIKNCTFHLDAKFRRYAIIF